MIKFKDYLAKEKIYESSASMVFRGCRIKDDAPVVLKMLKKERPDIKELTRYRNEYKLLQQLDIELVIDVHALEEHSSSLLLVTEDFNAQSLKILAEKQQFQLQELLTIFISVAKTLSLLHEQRIVHKDVTPANIVYDPSSKICKLIDFDLATQLSPSNPGQNQPNILEGTLAYISPEQTGRMNRQVDYRSDLYSLGVCMYELLTGKLPFEATRPKDLVYAHIANEPKTANEINPDVPALVSDIVAKLMAKTAELRYQSAAGLKADLETCLEMLDKTGDIGSFKLGRKDNFNIFYLPQKLYGRQKEVSTLLGTFNEQVLKRKEMVFLLISGYSGTGKTSLVKEIQVSAQSKGHFTEGKFDQHQRATPYYAFKQALSTLVNTWLSESREKLEFIKSELQEAMGQVGQVMVDMVPSLKLVIGPQSPVPELSGVEAQNRFNYVCRNFFRQAATAEHPLVIFIDDLQWADIASFNLIFTLLTDKQVTNFFLIGAYRDNEVSPAHPLMLLLESLNKEDVQPYTIRVENLSKNDVAALCADVLHSDDRDVEELSELIHTKTLGNPFFVTQFLKTLNAEGLITFDATSGQWKWNTDEIRQRNIPDDVVQLMAAKIETLTPTVQTLLTLAACIGNTFNFDTLNVISETEEKLVWEDLREALREGFILSQGRTHFRFSHDRIQQACYSFMRDPEILHLRIGRLLLKNYESEAAGENIFEIVNQLNQALRLVIDEQERLELAVLNQKAGLRAKSGTAYAAAIKYLTIARELLPEGAWSEQYTLTFSVHCELARCLYYAGETDEIENVFKILLDHAESIDDTVEVHIIRMLHHHLEGDYVGAVEIQKDVLTLLGVNIKVTDITTLLQNEMESVSQLLGDRSIEDLENEKLIDSPRHEAIMYILRELWTSAYLSSQLELVAWSSCKMTNISLEYGNNHLTSYGYMNYAFVCVAMLGQYETGHRFGKVAIRLADKFDDLLMRGKAYLMFAVFINHWRAPMRSSLPYYTKSFPLLIENGDWTYAGYCAEFVISDPTIHGASCQELLKEAKRYIPFLQNNAPVVLEEFVKPACLNPLLHLMGLTFSDKTLDDKDFSEKDFLRNYKNNPLALSYFYTAKLRSLYLFGYYDEALSMIDKADFVASFAPAQAKVVETIFYACLTIFVCWEKLSPEEQGKSLALLDGYQEKMETWAQNSPGNFLHKHQLLEAERARIESRNWDAFAGYQSAIMEANKSGYINNEALAHECCARFLLSRNQMSPGAYHMAEARYAYLKWGASGKVKQLDHQYADLPLAASVEYRNSRTLRTDETSHSLASIQQPSSSLDIISIIETSQTLAGEIDLDKLLNKMMKIVLENAGANRSTLLFPNGEKWLVKAEIQTGWKKAATPQTADEEKIRNDSLPLTLINYCARKRESIVLGSASSKGAFTTDPYFTSTGMKSALALPLINSGVLKGILYLENNLAEEVFTQSRLQLLELLSTQMVISIENAGFYKELELLVGSRTAELVEVNQELQKANRRLEALSNVDGLTQIFNRRYLDGYITREWKRHMRTQKDFSLIMCDVDYFKQFNDVYGHIAGDKCLQQIAQALNAVAVRPGDLTARYGGEEFAIVLPETDLQGLKIIIERIQNNVRELKIPHSKSDVSSYVTLSLGALHTVPPADKNPNDVLYSADLAMYEVKRHGRNNAVIMQEVVSCTRSTK